MASASVSTNVLHAPKLLNLLRILRRPTLVSNPLWIRSLHTRVISPATSSTHRPTASPTRHCGWSSLPAPQAVRSIFIQTENTPNADVSISNSYSRAITNSSRLSNSFPITLYCQRAFLLRSSNTCLPDPPWLPRTLRPWPRDSSTLMELHLFSMVLISSQSPRLRM